MKPHAFVLIFGALLIAGSAMGEVRFCEGSWRLELTGMAGIHSGDHERQGDFLLTGSAEYEFPIAARTQLGLRLLPVFLYEQEDDDRDHRDDENYDGETVVGAGAGIVFRFYQVKQEYRGLFGEIEASAIGHHHKIDGNSANLNFMTGIGLGYKFRNNWHVVLKYAHISNAGFGDDNAGANAVGLGVGYTF